MFIKKDYIKTILLIIFSLSVCNCSNINPPVILFPENNAIFQENQTITFKSNIEGEWFDNSTIFGNGLLITSNLNPGDHTIECYDSFGDRDFISITVLSDNLSIGDTKYLTASFNGNKRNLSTGSYSPVLYSINDNLSNLTISLKEKESTRSFLVYSENTNNEYSSEFSGIPRLGIPIINNNLLVNLENSNSNLNRSSSSRSILGNSLNFQMADINKGTMAPGYNILATLVASDDNYEIWLDDESLVDQDIWDEFINLMTEISLPRAKILWGDQIDRNNDGHLTILVSNKLNIDHLTIGFFNPSDYFEYNDNPDSQEYNPTSNERDMIYIGVPVSPDEDMSYSPEAIAATVAHEYQHLVRFGIKNYLPKISGSLTSEQEGSSFDEGMSHLTESLVGFGFSGGNVLFSYKYLLSPEAFSIRNTDLNGALDSVGKRGGTSLFFAWLLERAGGIRWDNEFPLELSNRDSSGIDFLRATQNYSHSGWDNIEIYFNTSLSELFRCYIQEQNMIISGMIDPPEIYYDPVTFEPTSLHPYLGTYTFGSKSYELNGPKTNSITSNIELPSWSVIYFEKIDINIESTLFLKTNQTETGTTFFGITRSQ